jgi:Inhibitor of vertebrate lysozyme (Ivy)
MRTWMSSRPLIGLLAFLCIEIAGGLCSAQTEQCEHPFNMSKRSPAAFAALQKIIPPKFRATDWIYRLDGVSDQVTAVSVGPLHQERLGPGPWYIYGSVCKPHDCSENNFSFLAEQYGSRAVALLVSQSEAPGETIILGSPTAIELTLLRAKIAQW